MDVLDKFFTKYSYKFPKGYPDLKDKQDILLMESILEELGVRVRVNEVGKLSLRGIKERPGRIEKVTQKFINKEKFTRSDTGEDIIIDKIIIRNVENEKGEKEDKTFTPESDPKEFVSTFNNVENGKDVDLFINGKDKSIGLSKLAKTPELGGGGGARGGSTQTKTQESSQSLVNSLRQNKGKDLTVKDLSDTTGLKNAYKDVDVDESEDKMINFIQTSPEWLESLVGTANILADKYGIDFIQHRQSVFVNELYKHAKKLIKEDKRTEGSTIGPDKWNPADIWMVKKGFQSTLEKLIQDTKDLDELNIVILQQYLDKNLIGVSLKLSDLNPNLSEFNTTGLTQTVDYGYEGYKPLNFTSKSTFIKYDKDNPKAEIEFRTFAPAFAGEIQGSKAGGGKIGLGALNIVFKNLNLPILSDLREVSKEEFLKLWNKFSDKKIDIKQLDSELSNISNTKVRGKDYNKGEIGVKDWLESRNFGLQVLDRIEESGSEKNKDKVIEDMLRYAASNSVWSSAFIKVY